MTGRFAQDGHSLDGRPLLRRETYLLEVICEHGVGHPVPGSVSHMDRHGPPGARGTWGVHGCDGCCAGLKPEPCIGACCR